MSFFYTPPKSELPPAEGPPRKRDWDKIYFRTGAAASAFLALSFINIKAGEYYGGQPFLAENIGWQYLDGSTCPPPPEVAIINANIATAGPQTAGIDKLLISKLSGEKQEKQAFDYFKSQAEANGLHLADYLPYQAEMKTAFTYDQINDVANRFLEEYGVSFSVPHLSGLKELFIGMKPLKVDALAFNPRRLGNYKTDMEATMEVLAVIPKEVVAFSGLKEVKLVESVNPSIGGNGLKSVGGFANPLTGITYLKPSYVGPDVFIHELSHHIDEKVCGLRGMDHDPGFTSLNRRGFKYGVNVGLANFNPNDATDPYNYTAPSEDKANTYASFLNGLETYNIYGGNTPVRRKTLYLLAQLEADVPGIAGYINAISIKGEPNPQPPAPFGKAVFNYPVAQK